MTETKPPRASADQERLAQLGERIRVARRHQRVPAVAAAQAAGISRVTLHRIERGEPTVAVGAWVAVAGALGLAFDLLDPSAAAKADKMPQRIRLGDYPELKKLAWQLQGVEEISPNEALDLYERNWRHVDRAALTQEEASLIDTLARDIGGGRLLV